MSRPRKKRSNSLPVEPPQPQGSDDEPFDVEAFEAEEEALAERLYDFDATSEPDPQPGEVERELIRERYRTLLRARVRHHAHLHDLDREEGRLFQIYARAFPGESLRPAAVPWTSLSHDERMTAHFIAVRGGIRRIRSLLDRYQLFSGEVLAAMTLVVRISRLHGKGVLDRCAAGWVVAPEFLDIAKIRPKQLAKDRVQVFRPSNNGPTWREIEAWSGED